jgi:prepilin-type N-terminal cleavage/methylation domain-containing protein
MMATTRRAVLARLRRRQDDGFGLIELMVAVALLALVMGSIGYLFLRATRVSNVNQQRQIAVMVAGQQLEFVRSVPADANIVLGRATGDVSALESEPASADLRLADNSPTSDAAAVAGSPNARVPLRKSVQVGNTQFSVRIYLRYCWRTPDNLRCDNKSGTTQAPANQLVRAWVAVAWEPAPGDRCSGYTPAVGGFRCEYVVSTVLNPNLAGDGLFR